MTGVVLRDYQKEAVDAIIDAIGRKIHPAVQLPTGGGKTVVFSHAAQQIGFPALVIAHRDELLDQAADKFRQVDPWIQIGKVKASQRQWWSEIVTASIQTLGREKGLAELENVLKTRPFKIAIVDEAHHATADTYMAVIGLLKRYGVPVVGVSATLERGDGSGLGGVFDELVYEKDLLWMIAQGYLSDIRAISIELKDFSFARVKTSRGDFQDGAMAGALHDAGAPQYALRAFLEHAEGRKAIAFCPTVELAHEFADVFTEGGVSCEVVDGNTPKDERKAIYKRLRDGETRVIASCAVLTEGFDEPSVDCVIVARPTMSRSLFIQMVGRGLRLFPGKQDCLVLDMVGNTDRVRLVTIANLFGLPSTWNQRQPGQPAPTVGAAVAAQQQDQQQAQRLLDMEAVTVDLFTQRKFQWIRTRGNNGNRYVLSAGDGMVVLVQGEDDLWTVRHEKRDRTVVEIADGLDLGYAQGAGEDYCRKLGSEILANKEAAWRKRPVSPKQVAALAKWKVAADTIAALKTAGEASDLLTEVIAAKTGKKVAA